MLLKGFEYMRKYLLPITVIFLMLALDIFLMSTQPKTIYQLNENESLKFPAFRTQDIKGNIITDEILYGKISMICLWVTEDAETSRELLTELSELQKNFSDKIQFVGLIGDVKEDDNPERIEFAKQIVYDCPNDFLQLLVNDDFYSFLTRLHNAPTICFTDENGNIIGQPIVGNEIQLIKKEATRLIEKDSPHVRALNSIQQDIFNHS